MPAHRIHHNSSSAMQHAASDRLPKHRNRKTNDPPAQQTGRKQPSGRRLCKRACPTSLTMHFPQTRGISHPRPATARLRRARATPHRGVAYASARARHPHRNTASQTCGLSHPRPATARLGRARATPHRGVAYASAPIGSHAGREMAGSSRAAWYSAGSRAFGTATSYTYSVNQSSLIVK